MRQNRLSKRAPAESGRGWMSIALILLLPLASAGQSKPVSHDDRQARLAFAPAPGKILTYDLSCLVDSSTRSFSGEELRIQAVSRGLIRMAVGAPQDGGTIIRLSSPGLDVSFLAGGASDRYRIRIPDDDPVRMVISRSGRILDVRNAERLERSNRMQFSVLDMLGFCFPALPDADCAAGGSWSEQRKIAFPFQGIKVEVGLRLPFLLRDAGGAGPHRIAYMSAEPEITLEGGGERDEMRMSVRGAGSGRVDLRFAVDEAVFEDYRLQAQIRGTILTRSQGIKLFDWPLSLTVSAFLTRRPDSKLDP